MKRVKETKYRFNNKEANIVGHLGYAAFKFWNELNYERLHYQEMGLEEYPDWYYQKKVHKDSFFARNLPSQTAQDVAKRLDEAWNSYFALLKKGETNNPHPPRFKQDKMPVTFMQKAIVQKGCNIRLSLPKQLKEFMKKEYGIDDNYLYLSNPVFEGITSIKQIKLYPPDTNGECRCIVIYEVEDSVMKEDNGNYLSIDLGINNLMTCYSNVSGETFIVGRMHLSLERKYLKQIERVQSQWYLVQKKKGVENPKTSKHIQKLYEKKNNCIQDYLHKITKKVIDYCKENSINTIIVGDITGIREEFNKGEVLNQKMHSLPFKKLVDKLTYKADDAGITVIRQEEYYTSQCSPLSPSVSSKYATGEKRIKRGRYIDGSREWNADSVGAYNILRLYGQKSKKEIHMEPIKTPYVVKVAV